MDLEGLDELPLDDSELDLPAELPLSQATSMGGGSLRDIAELPLSQGSAVSNQGVAEVLALPDDGLPEVAPEVAADGDDLLGTTAQTKQVSVFARRGRPNRAVQDAMREFLKAASAKRAEPNSSSSSSNYGVLAVERATEQPAPGAPDLTAMIRATNLAPEERVVVYKRPLDGLCPLPPVAATFDAACELVRSGVSVSKDEDMVSIAEDILKAVQHHMVSKSALAERLGVDRGKLTTAMPLLACGVYLADRSKRAKVESAAVMRKRPSDLMLFVDFCAYDETPLTVRLTSESAAGQPQIIKEAIPSELVPSMGANLALAHRLTNSTPLLSGLRNTKAPQKIIQTYQETGFLVKTEGSYVALISTTVCPLAVVDRCTAPALKEVQMRLSPVSRGSMGFAQAVRAVCTDSHPSNLAAERSIAQERQHQWSSLHTPCEIHKVAGCYGKTFIHLEDTVKGMISCGLSLRQGSSMTRFRKCLREEIASRFEVKAGVASRSAQSYKQHLLRLFVSHGTKVAVRQLLLVLCPNGDWRSPKVQFLVPHGQLGKVDKDAALEHVTTGLTIALAACQPDLYPRHRWTGADLAVDSLGILEGCHNLLSTTFRRFAASYEGVSRAARIMGVPQGLAAQVPGQSADRPAIADAQSSQAEAPEQNAGADMADQLPDDDTARATEDGCDWSAINAVRRKAASFWLAKKPWAKLVLLRTAMEPLRQLLARHFHTASEEWDLEQLKCVLDARAEGKEGWGMRDFRLRLAASCADEQKFFEQLQVAFQHADMWSVLPHDALNFEFRALTFKVLSRMGCCVHELLRHPHEQLPYQLFLLLWEPDLAESLLAKPACLWDAWSSKMRSEHPSLIGEDFMAKLGLIALMHWKDISRIEAKHASVRRLLFLASTHTHALSLEELSGQWCFLQVRRRTRRSTIVLQGDRPKKVFLGQCQ